MLTPVLAAAKRVLSVGVEPCYFEAFLASEYSCEMLGTGLPVHHPVGFTYEAIFEDARRSSRVTIPVTISEAGKDALPFPDCQFDLVLFLEVIEHLFCPPLFAASEMHRVLKPGGYLLLSTPNAQHWHRIAYLLAGRHYPDAEFKDHPSHRHHQVFSMAEVLELLTGAGFDVIVSRYEDCYGLAEEMRTPWAHAARLLSLLRQFRKENIFVLARRLAG